MWTGDWSAWRPAQGERGRRGSSNQKDQKSDKYATPRMRSCMTWALGMEASAMPPAYIGYGVGLGKSADESHHSLVDPL